MNVQQIILAIRMPPVEIQTVPTPALAIVVSQETETSVQVISGVTTST